MSGCTSFSGACWWHIWADGVNEKNHSHNTWRGFGGSHLRSYATNAEDGNISYLRWPGRTLATDDSSGCQWATLDLEASVVSLDPMVGALVGALVGVAACIGARDSEQPGLKSPSTQR